MADYNEMKDKMRREGMAEQTAKFMEMTNPTAQMFRAVQGSPPVDFSTPNPLAGLPVNPQAKADLDARYAEVDKQLAARDVAAARMPSPSSESVYFRNFSDKYGYGSATAHIAPARFIGQYADESPEKQRFASSTVYGSPDIDPVSDDYAALDRLEKQGLITVQPEMRAEIERVRALARKAASADTQSARAEAAAARVSPLNQAGQYRVGGNPETLRRRPDPTE